MGWYVATQDLLQEALIDRPEGNHCVECHKVIQANSKIYFLQMKPLRLVHAVCEQKKP